MADYADINVFGLPRSRTRRRGRVASRFFSKRGALVAGTFVLLLVIVAIIGPWLAPQDPNAQDLLIRNQPPSSAHLLGTDLYGRDLLSRLIVGTRVTLLAAGITLVVAVLIGVPMGLLAGYGGKAIDAVLSRIADAILSLPTLILVLAIIAVLGSGIDRAMIAAGIATSPTLFRVVRSVAKRLSNEQFVEAARADGESTSRVLFRHILPNASGPLLVQVSFVLGFGIIVEASLSFLGLGVKVPQASWGSMLEEAYTQVNHASFQLFPPIIMIALTVFSLTVVGDALRDSISSRSGDAK